MKQLIILAYSLSIIGCTSTTSTKSKNSNSLLKIQPNTLLSELVPDSLIVHRGVFSNNLETYYFTVSKKDFTDFTILESKQMENGWSTPRETFFNSSFDDHGMSFSPDGNTLVFASTRPIENKIIPRTWHIWTCKKTKSIWSNATYLDIPNLSDKLLSHPTLGPDGTIYFHASELDYSNMKIYQSHLVDGSYEPATEITFPTLNAIGYCTPYVSSDGNYLLFAAIGESLKLYYVLNLGKGQWSDPVALPDEINTHGQGNPYLTQDVQLLLYASASKAGWQINKVSTQTFLPANQVEY